MNRLIALNLIRFMLYLQVLGPVTAYGATEPGRELEPALVSQMMPLLSIQTEPSVRWNAIGVLQQMVSGGSSAALRPEILQEFLVQTQDLHLRLSTLGGAAVLEAGAPFRFLLKAFEQDPELARNPDLLAFIDRHVEAIRSFARSGDNAVRYKDDLKDAARWYGELERTIERAQALAS